MPPILLDTNALVWLVQSSPRLGRKAAQLIDRARQGRALVVSAISFWEVANMTQKRKLKISIPLSKWREEILALGIGEIAFDGAQAIRAAELLDSHPDPFDRFILAAAESCDAQLMTSEHVLLKWRGKLKRHDATE